MCCWSAVIAVAAALISPPCASASTYQTVNFAVTADRPEIAAEVGQQAEVYRRQLAIFWLGRPLPNWGRPCRITVREGALGAGGQTTFQFIRGEVLNWRMTVQGTRERILDSVLPHEINHTIFASYFRRPLPRWADEGAATLFEHRSEQLKQLHLLEQVINRANERISLRDLLSMKEYPRGQRAMLTLYAQGYTLADFLVQQKGRAAFLTLLADAERIGWEEAIRTSFDHDGIESLERNWRGWVLAGMPKLTLPREQMLASTQRSETTGTLEAARPELTGSVSMSDDSPLPLSVDGDVPRTQHRADIATVRLQSPDATASDGQEMKTERRRTPTLSASPPRAQPTAPVRRSQSPASESQPTHRGTIEAPAPRSRNAAGETGTQRFANDSFEAAAPAELESAFIEPDEVTSRPPASRDRDSDWAATGSETTLQEPPTRERKPNAGPTPQWAGFPGQSKLF
jgi:hypothetical protein